MVFRRRLLVLFLMGVFVCYLAGLGSFPLTERSEARYTEVAWEMLRSNDYLVPRYNGIVHLHKPPLLYWSVATSMGAFGSSEGTARVPSLISALLILVAVVQWSRRPSMGASGWWISGVVLACSPFFWEMSRLVVTDMMLTLFVVGALWAAWAILDSGASLRRLLMFWLCLGLGFLTKGPVAPLWAALVLGPYLVITGRTRAWREFHPGIGLCLASVVALPWYVWIVWKTPGLLEYFVKFQTVDRVVSTVPHREGGIWYYLPVILGGGLPWSVWLPRALWQAWKGRGDPPPGAPNPDLFLFLWIVVPFVFFSLIGSKLPPYVLPTFPAIALLFARRAPVSTRRGFLGPLTLLGGVGLSALVLSSFPLIAHLDRYSGELRWGGVWLVGCALVGAGLYRNQRPRGLMLILIVSSLGTLLLLGIGATKATHLSARDMARAIRFAADGPYEVAMARAYLFGLPYYLNQTIVHVDYPREVRFERDTSRYRDRIYPSVSSYLPVFRNNDIDHFFVVSVHDHELLSELRNETVIYRDGKFVVFCRPRSHR